MKKEVLLMALLCIGNLAFAQKTETATKEYTQRIPKTLSDEGIFGIAVPCTETYHYYYDDDDNRIKHGLSSITGAYNITRNGVTIDEKFSGTANYAGGELNGKVQQSYYIILKGKGESINISWSFSGGYVDGLADGVWTYSETNKVETKKKKESENDTFTVSFNAGRVSSITYTDGIKNIVDENGAVTGLWDGFRIKNNIITDYFKRKNGDVSKAESEQENLINGYINGVFSSQDIINQGYDVVVYTEDAGMLDYFCSRVGNSNYVDIGFLGGYFVPQINNRLFILRKVNLAAFEDVKAAITFSENGEISMERYNQLNERGCIYLNGTTYYLSSEMKQKMDNFVEENLYVKREEIMAQVNKLIENANSKETLKKKYLDYASSMQLLKEDQKKELLTKYQRKLYALEQKDFDIIIREIKGNFSKPFPRLDYIHQSENFTNTVLKASLTEAIEKQPQAIEASAALKRALDQIMAISQNRKITKKPVEIISADYNSNPSNWAAFYGQSIQEQLPMKIAPFCPMSEYKIIAADYLKDGGFSYSVEWTQQISKKEQKKYISNFVVSKDKTHVELDSFDFAKAIEK